MLNWRKDYTYAFSYTINIVYITFEKKSIVARKTIVGCWCVGSTNGFGDWQVPAWMANLWNTNIMFLDIIHSPVFI
jgi:hypothetical protein